MKMSRIASIKGGTERRPKAMPETARSKPEPGRTAQRMASGTPISRPPSSAMTRSSSETGRRPAAGGNNLSPGRGGEAEIAFEHRAQPLEIALPQRQVEAELLMECRYRLGRRLVAEHGDGEIARQQVGDQKAERRNRQDDGKEIEQLAADQGEHCLVCLARAAISAHSRSARSPIWLARR